LLICISLVMSTPFAGQSLTTGDIAGVVTDASAAVVMKATVTLRSNEKGFNQTVTTNAEGVYRFPFLAVVTENSVRAGNAKILSACRHSLPEKLIEGTIQ
jgi:hypothetical protein